MTIKERKNAAIGIMLVAVLIGSWYQSLQIVDSKAYQRGRRALHIELLSKWIDENGKHSTAPLLVPSPWIPSGNLDNINSKNYSRGDL